MRGSLRTSSIAAVAALGVGAWASCVVAEEIAPGTVVTAASIDRLNAGTFEGTTLSDLMIPRLDWQVRNHGLSVTLKKSQEPPLDPRQIAKTAKYKGQATLDPATHNIINYTAGIPFPDLKADDPEAGAKAIWNFYFGWRPFDIILGRFSYVLIDGRRGPDRTQEWWFRRYHMASRNTTEQDFEGDGSIYHKTLLFAQAPQDIKGLGTFSIRYMSPKLDDVWAYVRTVRRVRRLSGGAWMDPIGGTDELQDDIAIFNAHPTWYTQYKLLGKKKLLTVANSKWTYDVGTWNENGKSIAEQFPHIDFGTAPYWNVHDRWEPRDVWVVEAVAPVEHPYSRKVVYIDAKTWFATIGEAYDRKGDWWKWMQYATSPVTSADGSGARFEQSAWIQFIDFQREHATHIGISKEHHYNPLGLSQDDFTLSQLESGGR